MMVLDPYVTFYGLFVECGCCSMLLYDFYVLYVSYVVPFIMSVVIMLNNVVENVLKKNTQVPSIFITPNT